MLRAPITFLILGLLCILPGAYNVAGLAPELGRRVLYGFATLALVTFVYLLITDHHAKEHT